MRVLGLIILAIWGGSAILLVLAAIGSKLSRRVRRWFVVND